MTACSSNGMQSICLFYFIIIIRDEFEFDDLKYCVLISVLRFTIECYDKIINIISTKQQIYKN